MADKKFDLVFNASLEVGQVKAAVASLTKSLESAGAKIPQSMANNLNRMIQSLNTELNKLEGMTDIQLDPKNAKNVGKSYEKIFQTFQQIKAALGDINRTAGIDPEKFFPSEIASNIAKAAQAVQKYKKAMETGVKTDEHTQTSKDIAKASKEAEDLQKKLNEAIRKRDEASNTKQVLQNQRAELQAKKDAADAEVKAAKDSEKVIKDKIESQKRMAQVEADIAKKKKAQQAAVDKAAKANEVKNERENMKQAKGKGTDTKIYRDAVVSYAESTAEVQKLQNEIDQLEEEFNQLSQSATVSNDDLVAATEKVTKATEELSNAQKSLNKNQAAMDSEDTRYAAAVGEIQTLTPEVQKAEQVLEQLRLKKQQLEASFEQSTFNELIQELEKLGINLPEAERNMEGVERALENLSSEAKDKVTQAFNGITTATEDVNKALKQTGEKADSISELGEQASRAEQDMENLKNQVLDFFSITNTIQIFKNAIRDAFDTVKELDAAMTETAVVTDFSIGDMWDKLPEYSAEATKLGASIKSLYEATTLYYQQGLNTEQAMGVGIETMKMARIANMDAAQATEAMTAALRGFNMEINEISATRVNDVYSELAAITAADTSQIATAMSKTASIAKSANMEFETTAALLAQIIETTQEAPETAGTAMKTIIARFTEVKQLFSKGMLTGEDSEGEEININKIDAALKTVGISLKDFLTGSKGIDDIFLELASKWDTLDLATQRYIATAAAGSRQQSRFLAMMGNYERTMELVTAANNSAGASQKQFSKTLESLDAKIQRLKNAWAEFTMGLANSDAIKFVVDLLTNLIESVNKVTGLFGNDGLGGFVTMLIRLAAVITSLKSGEAILNGILKTLSSTGVSSIFGIDLNDKKINFFAPLTNDLKLLAKEWKRGDGLLKNLKIGLKGVRAEGTGLLSILVKYGKYIGIFTLLAGAVLLVAKAFREAQDSAKLEAINKSIEEMSTEAEKAKEELSEITSARQKLNEMNDTFGNLTRGTSEWTSALIETNSQVLDLLEKYSILKANIGEYGQLVIDSGSWDDLLAQQQQVIFNMNAAKLVLQSEREQLQASINLDSFIINSKASETQKKMTEWDLKLSKFYDSKVFGIDGTRWGDLIFNNPIMRTQNTGKSFEEPIITGNTGGLTESQMINLAEIFAYNGAAINENYEAQYDNLIKQLGEDIDVEKIKTFLTSTSEVSSAFNELIVSSYGVAEAQKNLTSAFVSNAIANSKIAKEKEAESIGNIITKNQNASLDSQVDSKVEEIRAAYSDEDDKLDAAKIAKEYAAIMGYESANGEVYTDATYSTPVQASVEAMLRAIATDKITVEVQEQAKTAWDTISTKKTDERELFKNLFSQDGKEITAAQINTYQSKDGKIDFNKILEDMGLTVQEAEASLSMTFDGITEMLVTNFENASNRISKERRDLTRRMTKYSPDKKKNFETNANDLAGLEEKFGEQIRTTLNSALNSFEITGDFNITSEGFEYFKNVAISGTEEELQQLVNLIDRINWNDSIEGAYQLRTELENGTEITQGLAHVISEVKSEYFSAASQFDTFFKSDVYSDIEEDLIKVYELQGQIAEQDIRDLASEYSYLNKMMKNTSTTAKGLADILNSIKEGTLQFEDLTDAVIAAIGGMDSLGDATSEVLQRLQNIDLGDDLGEVQDIYTEFAEKIKEFQENSEYGNPQYKSILEYYFGKGFEGDRVGDDLIDWYIYLGDQIEKYSTDMYYGWEQAAKGVNIYGEAIKGQTDALKEYGIQLEMINGQVVFNVPDDMTFEETAANLAKVIGGTKEHWEDMITYFANRTPEMWRTWEQADYNQTGKRIAEAETTNIVGKKIITEEELNNITAGIQLTYPEKDLKTIKAEIKEQLGENEVKILTMLDTKDISAQAQHIIAQLDSMFGEKAGSFAEKFYSSFNNAPSFNFSGLLNAVQNLKLPEEITNQIVNGITAGAAEAGKAITYEVEGETRQLDLNLVANGTEFVEAVNAQIAEAEAAADNAELDNTAKVTIDQGIWQASVNSAKAYIGNVLSNLKYPIVGYVSEVDTSQVDLTKNTTPHSNNTNNNSSTKFAKLAEGTKRHSKDEMALTGEEGPELVETKDGAYLTGTEGPQMAKINRGDTVYTADETKEIYKRKGISVPAYKGGAIGPISGSSGGSGGSGGTNASSKSDDDKEDWENPFDKLYNLVREIDEELRRRERLERRYEKLLESVDLTADKLFDNAVKQLRQLEKEKLLNKELQEARRSQIQQYQQENADLMKYAKVVQNERGEDVLRIHWDQINLVEDPERGQRIEDYVSQLEEWFDSLEEAEDKLNDIEDRIEEVKELGKEEYLDFENAVKDAITFAYQEEIDKLSEINESINDTNTQLIDAISKQVNRIRQQRENERTEQELQEKQRQLLYLSQDTSGANDMAILELQREIEEGTVDYTDTLIDQKIDELQMQNDEAAQQREQQITLMQAQLDHLIQSGEIWDEVYSLMDEGLDPEAGLIRGSRLEQILKNAEGFQGMSKIQQMDWLKELQQQAAQAIVYMRLTTEKIDTAVELNRQNHFGGTTPEPEYNGNSSGSSGGGGSSSGGGGSSSGGSSYSSSTAQTQQMLKNAGYNIAVDGIWGPKTQAAWDDYQAKKKQQVSSGLSSEAAREEHIKEKNTHQWKIYTPGGSYITTYTGTIARMNASFPAKSYKRVQVYKKGGLADFTGPAWLDGTKSRPELVLNQKDTQNFIQLKDILASLMTGSHTSTENNGDITYDIDINVESISSDYDVEQVANKVKSLINEDARYRNNNAVSLKR